VNVACQLRRSSEQAQASALLLFSHEPRDLLHLCAALGSDASPVCHVVADGFLVHLPRPTSTVFPGVLRLRALARHLLLPIDAELLPALLEEEAAALTRKQGLVFLPHSRVLQYDPDRAVPLSSLLTCIRRPDLDWQPFPKEPPPPSKKPAPVPDFPQTLPAEFFAEGGQGVGVEESRPDGAGLPARALGSIAFYFGGALAASGELLHLWRLVGAGANLINRALNLTPRLSERLLGMQEAALRALLRDFRTGNIEQALRRALPLGGRGGGPASVASNARLPFHNTRYSLGNILKGYRGPFSIWFAGYDVLTELFNEYRKQAEEAARRGDHRRAAFIHGKLLHDYRAAANVLAKGGVHLDAAILLLTVVGDKIAAAGEYEAAGDYERALALYRQCGKHGMAGDLLRRLGQEEEALAEYWLAAEKLVAANGHYQAGEFLLNRAVLPDLALAYFEAGWGARPAANALPCAIRMAQIYTERESVARLMSHALQVDDYLQATAVGAPASEFYNEMARLAMKPALAGIADDVRDLALMGLAGQLRQCLQYKRSPVEPVSMLFGQSPLWAPALIHDARFAARAARKREPEAIPAQSAMTVIPAVRPQVTAVCWAPGTEEIILGFASGEIFCYRPRDGITLPVNSPHDCGASVVALTTGSKAQTIVALTMGQDDALLKCYERTMDGFRRAEQQVVHTTDEAYVAPLLAGNDERCLMVWTGHELQLFRLPGLISIARTRFPNHLECVCGALFAWLGTYESPEPIYLVFDGTEIRQCSYDQELAPLELATLGWHPRGPKGSVRSRPWLDWRKLSPNELELLGIGDAGILRRSVLSFDGGMIQSLNAVHYSHNFTERVRAAAFIRWRSLAAAVTEQGVYWMQTHTNRFCLAGLTKRPFPEAIACFPHTDGHALIVVNSAGTIESVRIEA
jgi:tetratricopeptide (TPR) repeat protein